MAARRDRLTGGVLFLAMAASLGVGGVIGHRVLTDRARREVRSADARLLDSMSGELAKSSAELDRALTLGAIETAGLSQAVPRALESGRLLAEGIVGSVEQLRAEAAGPRAGRRLAGNASPGMAQTVLTDAPQILELTRDIARPQAVMTDLGLAVVAPEYSAVIVPAGTAERRREISGWLVAAIDEERLLSRIAGSEQGRASLTTRSAQRTDGRPVDVAGLPLLLDLEQTGTGAPPDAWAVLALGVAGAAAVLVVGTRGRRLALRNAAATEALARETRTLAELGPLLQRSLDLGDVLPAVSIRLADEFGLRRVTVALRGEQGAIVDMFNLGPQGPVGDGVVDLPLVRAGRTIGALRVEPRTPLQPNQVDALRAAADLVAVASYNAELYEREQVAVRRLTELDQLKDSFLGTISHELRTPITAISGFVGLLSSRWTELTDAERNEFFQRLERNTASLRLLVDELLDFARLERQALSVSSVPVAVDEVVGTIVAQLVPLLGNHEVRTDLHGGSTAYADPSALERILANLLTNATKFSDPGSRIDVSVRPVGDEVEIEVADEGPGISADDRPRIFSRFYRGESDAARATRGAGIGLAVVRELVDQMAGSVSAHDRTPHGTRMVVRLPGVAAPDHVPMPRSSTPLSLPSLDGITTRSAS